VSSAPTTGPRPKLSWSDLAGTRAGIWGLGREGHANLRKLLALGAEPVLVDDRPSGPVDGRPVFATADGGLAALQRCDVVVKTPGLSRYRPEVAQLSAAGIPVVGGLGLWLAEADLRRVLCVTGTKGKSTTSSLTGHLLTGLGYRCMVGGNIGAVPYDPGNAGDFDFWVIEVSSYQATDLPCSPPVVAVTSLHPDHLDWHGSVEQYYRDKLSACSQPGAELTVANGDSALLREHAGLLGPRIDWVSEHDDPDATWMDPLGLPGRHNRRNALIARRCLAALGVPGAADATALRGAAAGYQPLPSRLTPVGTVGGVSFVDDSLSTNVLPTLAALDAFPGRRIALIVGGHDRGIDYAPLAVGIVARDAPTYVLTLPDSGPRIRTHLEAATPPATSAPPTPSAPVAPPLAPGQRHETGNSVRSNAVKPGFQSVAEAASASEEAAPPPAAAPPPTPLAPSVPGFAGVTDCPDLATAVAAGYRWAQPDGIVLLSPAAPSFGLFKDYRDRAEAFAREVRALT
jgi:UDP-N-acetylmuramoylalanine--D-glutamate ligase